MFVPLLGTLLAAAPTASEVILGGALGEGGAMARVTDLSDRVGPRLSGCAGRWTSSAPRESMCGPNR
jgi:hypothetical protein